MSIYDNLQSMVIAKRKTPPPPIAPAAEAQTDRDLTPPTPPAEAPGTPVFLTPQSFLTFPGTSLAVLILTKTAEVVFPSIHNVHAVPVLASLVIGGVIYWASLTPDMTRKDQVIGACLAFLNSCYVALFVIGIPLTLSQMQESTPTPTPAAATPAQPKSVLASPASAETISAPFRRGTRELSGSGA